MEILASHSSESWSKAGKRLLPEQGCNEAGAVPLHSPFFSLPFLFSFPFLYSLPFLIFLSSPLLTPAPFLAVQSPPLATHQIEPLDVDVIMTDILLNPPSFIISIIFLFLRTELLLE